MSDAPVEYDGEIVIKIKDGNVSCQSKLDVFELTFWLDVAKQLVMRKVVDDDAAVAN